MDMPGERNRVPADMATPTSESLQPALDSMAGLRVCPHTEALVQSRAAVVSLAPVHPLIHTKVCKCDGQAGTHAGTIG